MNDKIISCNFTLHACKNKTLNPEKNDGYNVYINFHTQSNQVYQKKLTIIKEYPEKILSKTPVLDMYSYNGISSSKTNTLLNDKNFSNNKSCKETVAVMEKILQQKNSKHQILFVLDLKDFPNNPNESSYKNIETIKKSEKNFLDLFTGNKNTSKKNALEFKEILTSALCDYVILEGSLKADFIGDNALSKQEKEFLQSKGVGSSSFCQLIEFFMNAFKRGEKVIVKKQHESPTVFSAKTYLKKLNPKALDYEPTNQSRTIYPEDYYDIATQGIYTKAMKNSTLFSVKNIPHENNIIEMITTKPGY